MKKGELTKRNIANAFKSLMEKNDFDSITITDITNECDLNRLTFYYHFKDKTDLLSWIFYDDVIRPVKENISAENWRERLMQVLSEMYSRKEFYKEIITYDRLDIWNYMFEAALDIMKDTVKTSIGEGELSEQDIITIAYFFAFGISGTIYDWAANGMQKSPVEFTERFISLVEKCKKLNCYNRRIENA